MIRAGAGLSTAEEAERAAHEASAAALDQAGCERVSWGLVFATASHRPALCDLLGAVVTELGTERIAGCTGAGVLTHEGEVEGGAGIAVLAVASDDLAAEPFLLRGGGEGGAEAAWEGTAAFPGEHTEAELMVVMNDPLHVRIESLLSAFAVRLGPVPVVGAVAAEDGSLGATYQFCGRDSASGSVAGLRLTGSFRTAIGLTQGCHPVGEPCIVTKVRGGDVTELDGRPALRVLLEQIPRTLLSDPAGLARSLFVALPPAPEDRQFTPGEYLIRSIARLDTRRGAFSIAGASLREGQVLSFALRAPDAAREDLKRMIEGVGEAATGSAWSFGLYFNCAGRGSALYGLPGVDTAYLSAALRGVPLAGFFGNGEIAPLRGASRLFTHTGVLALVGQQPAGPGAPVV